MNLENMYQELILDHYKHPQGTAILENFDAEVFHVNTSCGDEVRLRIKIDNSNVFDISHESQGCSISQASTSMMVELVKGQELSVGFRLQEIFSNLMHAQGKDVQDQDELGDAVAFQGVAQFPARVKCALLGWMAFRDAATQAMETK